MLFLTAKHAIYVKNTTFLVPNDCLYKKYILSLRRVFHSIRFKVNKGWGKALPLFLFYNPILYYFSLVSTLIHFNHNTIIIVNYCIT